MSTQALSVKNHYDHVDFKGNYASLLGWDSHGCIKRIKEIIRIDSESFGLPPYTVITDEQAEMILNWFIDNPQEYSDYSNYYVGSYCIDSISFGGQHHEIQKEDGKSLEDLQEEFEKEDFYVNGIVTYYDLSDTGVYWDLRDMPKDELTNILH